MNIFNNLLGGADSVESIRKPNYPMIILFILFMLFIVLVNPFIFQQVTKNECVDCITNKKMTYLKHFVYNIWILGIDIMCLIILHIIYTLTFTKTFVN